MKKTIIASLWVLGLIGLVALEVAMGRMARAGDHFQSNVIHVGMVALLVFALASALLRTNQGVVGVWTISLIVAVIGLFTLCIVVANQQAGGESFSEQEKRYLAQVEFLDGMASEARGVINSSQGAAPPETPPEIRERVFVLHDKADEAPDLDSRCFGCPGALTLEEVVSSKDTPMTLFFVAVRDATKVGHYGGVLGGAAYSVRFDVYCIEWPEKRLVAKHSIYSYPPEKSSGGLKLWGRSGDVDEWIEKTRKKLRSSPNPTGAVDAPIACLFAFDHQ